MEEFFRGCCGVIPAEDEPVRVVVKAHENGAKYLRSLPLHESQREFSVGEDIFLEYEVCPNYDFYQSLLTMGEQVEVVEPAEAREEMRRIVGTLAGYYK